ncbi:ubiquitin-conjugating enzyme E2 J2-like [Amyelois transitella]|uniref:ubiquitin-conjugating enzyme E2 J2-like n=1 Tax=Amyelois transitella TaxID=680683 RepID=UPI00067CE458|nr:ubiquitin-conjugating enzyme E2 J2-like [Amyelois transitella]
MAKTKVTGATRRLKQDYFRLKNDPVPYVTAEPVPSNILEWHYVVKGPEKSPYEGGYYHGKIIFPREFPFKPPSIYMITPNGRFKTNTRLCLSITDFHPDTWNPAWSISTILTGLLSFMLEKTPTLGSIETSDYQKRCLAAESLEINLKNKMFCELFPDYVEEIELQLKQRQEAMLHSVNTHMNSESDMTTTEQQSSLYYILTNLFVLVGFVFLAYMVKYVLVSISND